MGGAPARETGAPAVPRAPGASGAYLRGRHLFNIGTPDAYDRSVAALERAVSLDPDDLGDPAEERRAFDELRERFADSEPHQLALVEAWRGERDAAFAWLERALVPKNLRLRYLELDPLLRRIRGDSRYAQLLRRLDLPAEGDAASSMVAPLTPPPEDRAAFPDPARRA